MLTAEKAMESDGHNLVTYLLEVEQASCQYMEQIILQTESHLSISVQPMSFRYPKPQELRALTVYISEQV
jgi:hypothetical protein